MPGREKPIHDLRSKPSDAVFGSPLTPIRRLFGGVPGAPVVLVFAITAVVGLSCCRYVYVVRTTGGDLNSYAYTQCGTAMFQMQGRGRHSFALMQHYSGAAGMQLNFDSLRIAFNGDAVDYKITDKSSGKPVSHEMIRISGDQDLMAEFTVSQGVYEFDTIAVDLQGYIDCPSGTSIHIAPIIFHFNRPSD